MPAATAIIISCVLRDANKKEEWNNKYSESPAVQTQPGQHSPHFLRRDGEPPGDACDLTSLVLPHLGNHQIRKIFRKLLETALPNHSLGPRLQSRIRIASAHYTVL